VEGIVDRLQAAGLRSFGPTQAAARLEGSKAFSKEFMRRYAIPTADAATFTELEDALDFLESLDAAPVIKASGLAAGKGVLLPASKDEAAHVLRAMLVERQFGEAGATVLIEERLAGPELSVLAFCDGVTARIMPPAQDHKRLLDADQGPNTGGMGAFAPSPLATPELLAEVERTVLQPTLAGMAAEGSPYVGVLYAGLMLTDAGPKVLEFNARFGDPETEVILPLLESDLVEALLACCAGRLAEVELRWRPGAAVTVVMASGGYPGNYATGLPISGIEQAEAAGCTVFHAGTRAEQGQIVTAGGRVLAVTAAADDLPAAAARAYAGVNDIHFEGSHHRTDIAANLTP
jgi:phosphoribosylamine--glycine ligase